MTATADISASTRLLDRSGTRPLAWAVLVTAVLQVAAPVISSLVGGTPAGEGSGPELLITPVGWAFSIWGVIYGLALAQAIAVLVNGAARVPRALQVAQVTLYLGGTLWIAMAALDSSLATALALTLMLAAAVPAVLVAARAHVEPHWLALLTRAAVGLYAGWVTAAFFLNVSTALVDAGVVEESELGWQVAMLVLAVVVLLAVLVAARATLGYAAAAAWALLGIAVTGSDNDLTSVLVVTGIGALAVVAVVVGMRSSGRTPGAPS